MMVPTSPKPASKVTAAPRVKRLVKSSSPSTKPFLRFYHSETLRAKTLSVLTTLEKAKDRKQHRDVPHDPRKSERPQATPRCVGGHRRGAHRQRPGILLPETVEACQGGLLRRAIGQPRHGSCKADIRIRHP